MKKIEIMPSYIYEFDMPKDLTQQAFEIAQQIDYKPTPSRPNQSSVEMDIDKYLPKSSKIVMDKMYEISKEHNFSIKELKIVNAHSNKTNHMEFHTPHDHANTVFSSIWYLNDCDCETYFYRLNDWMDQWINIYPLRVRGGSMGGSWVFRYLDWYDIEGKNLVENFKPFIIHKQKSIAGKLIVFPAKMLHLTNTNKSLHTRYTFTFNVFPTKFGQSTITVK